MNEITEISPQAKDKRRCNVYVDGRFCCGLTLETVVRGRLKVGQTVTAERLAELQLESEKNTALDKALSHLSATRKTEREMRDFLAKKGYLPAVADYVTEKLRAYDLLDDGAYAEAYTEQAVRTKGGRLIRAELRRKGVGEEAIDAALSAVSEEQTLLSAKTLLEKYMRGKEATVQNLQKAYQYLTRKGFDYETAKSALTELGELYEE